MADKIKIVLASGNPHKLQEISDITKGSGIEFVLVQGDFDPEENGTTFEQNSYIKAKTASEIMNCISLADDSGLCVEFLNGAPGIHSARYAKTQQEKIDKLLYNLRQADNRNAKFVCAMTLVDKDGNVIHREIGECPGKIAESQNGVNGFGYDPIFIPQGYDITMAQMSEEQKNKISHRGRALSKMIKFIKENL